ncbi:hypothetical protein TELCIR_00843 [Teladorsagia circumcincta]|uniref:ERAP1-like C-terminal domain-containing protein n=1 Tax=Teladorsagia circumcincta TaxID=45464 RepID=A0A2G9V5N7_TELCI|nr:hypothetical protein TELCIR_00843 [Teladorsagia circumcincta]
MILIVLDNPLHISGNTAEEPLVVNADRRGLYRQNYDDDGWRKITTQLMKDHERYSPRTKSAIVSDAFAAAAIKLVNYTTVLDILEYLKQETVRVQVVPERHWIILRIRRVNFQIEDYLPWSIALEGLRFIGYHFRTGDGAEAFKLYTRSLVKPIYNDRFFSDVAKHHKVDKFFLERYTQWYTCTMYSLISS